MTAAATTETAPVEHFHSLYEHRSFALARDEMRAAALERLRQTGFPLRHNESWAHTPLRDLLRVPYRLPTEQTQDQQPHWLPWQRGESGAARVLLAVDGRAGDGTEAADHGPATAGSWRAGPGPAADAFDNLRIVFADTPRQIVVPGDSASAPVRYHIAHLISDGVVAAPRTRIVLEAGARATIVESFESAAGRGGTPGGEPSLCLPHTEVVVGEGAQLELVRLQAEAQSAFHVSAATIEQAADSRVDVVSIDLGAALARGSLTALIGGSGASCHLSGVSVAGDAQLMDAQTVLEHAAPESQSRQLYKRVLTGASNAVFAGRIVVREAAQQTDAFQLNSNLLLGSGSAVSKPQLEIAADDVRCSHGATVGQLDDDQLFYLRARGIPPGTARVMLANGFCAEPVAGLADPELRAAAGALIAAELSERLAAAETRVDG